MNRSIKSRVALIAMVGALTGTNVSAGDGMLDTGFGAGAGWVAPDLSSVPGEYAAHLPAGVARDAQGRLLVSGALLRASDFSRECFVMRLLADGSLDTSFSPPDGFRTIGAGLPAYPGELCTAVAPLPDGRIVVAGAAANAAFTRYTAIVAMLDANGALDPSFYGNGLFAAVSDLPQIDFPDTANAIERLQVDANGRVLALGSFYGVGGSFSQSGLLLRFLPETGALDAGFGGPLAPGLVVLTDAHNGNNLAPAGIAHDAQGRLLAVGSGGGRLKVFRMNDDGSFDASFGAGMTPQGGNGVGYIPGCNHATDFAIDAQQRWLHACARYGATSAQDRSGVMRTFANGELDLDFGVDGFGAAPPVDAIGRFDAGRLAVQGDGKLLLAGRYSVDASSLWGVVGKTDLYALRLGEDGLLDPEFGDGAGYKLFRFGDLPAGGMFDNRHEVGQGMMIDAEGRPIIVGHRENNASTSAEMVVMRLTRVAPPATDIFGDGFESSER